jgi:hypothetical protein
MSGSKGLAGTKVFIGRSVRSDFSGLLELWQLDDAETRVVRRTTTTPVRNIKADRPWTVPSVS